MVFMDKMAFLKATLQPLPKLYYPQLQLLQMLKTLPIWLHFSYSLNPYSAPLPNHQFGPIPLIQPQVPPQAQAVQIQLQ